MEHPILNPSNPYLGTLRVFPGTLVKVAGRARPNATRFAINFQTGPSINPRDDLALHLSPCFTPPRIIRNSLTNGAWGLEEAWGNGSILSPHAPFEIMILAEAEQFKIAVNGAHYCEFRHRIPYQHITHLTVDGDLDIDRLSIVSQDTYNRQLPQTAGYQPTAPPPMPTQSPPYPSGGQAGSMPMPPLYPNLGPQPTASVGPYPNVPASMPQPGPMPTPASYGSGYPQQAGPYPGVAGPGSYPHAQPTMGGPAPAPSGYYQSGPYQQPQAPHGAQPGHSSTSTPFGNIPIGGKALGTIAGLGLGAAAGAAALSALNPLKTVKKIMKPHKMMKHKKWGHSSSSSSSSSNGSFSSNSS